MSWTLLMPACVVVLALVSLTIGLRRVEGELSALRDSLRRTSATAVAADELHRTTGIVADRAAAVEADARRRLRRPRNRRPPSAR